MKIFKSQLNDKVKNTDNMTSVLFSRQMVDCLVWFAYSVEYRSALIDILFDLIHLIVERE